MKQLTLLKCRQHLGSRHLCEDHVFLDLGLPDDLDSKICFLQLILSELVCQPSWSGKTSSQEIFPITPNKARRSSSRESSRTSIRPTTTHHQGGCLTLAPTGSPVAVP